MAQARRTNSRNSLLSNKESNKSNSNSARITRTPTSEKENLILKKQNSSSSLKILGQDDEVSEDALWNGTVSDRNTPISSRSSLGSRPGSSRRTPTPSKQISLQAVRRKEEKVEPLEPIDWNEFNKPILAEERLPPLHASDSDSDIFSPRDTQLSAEEHLNLVEQRTQQMTSALSSCRMDDQEADLSRQLLSIETEREERERKIKDELEKHDKKPDPGLTVEDGQFTYRNEHFRDLSKRDHRDKIDSDFIMDGAGASNDYKLQVGSQPQKRIGENVIGRHAMDKNQVTAIGTVSETQDVKQERCESDKKDEASAETSSDDDSNDDDDDLIGERGKAPNTLLMEFLTCMMEEDYENAEKLCKMILIYEPENPEALSFFPLIQEKRRQEEEEEDDEEDSSDESDDSGEEEGSDEDNTDDEDDDDDEEENSSEESDREPITHLDSGIASANSD